MQSKAIIFLLSVKTKFVGEWKNEQKDNRYAKTVDGIMGNMQYMFK